MEIRYAFAIGLLAILHSLLTVALPMSSSQASAQLARYDANKSFGTGLVYHIAVHDTATSSHRPTKGAFGFLSAVSANLKVAPKSLVESHYFARADSAIMNVNINSMVDQQTLAIGLDMLATECLTRSLISNFSFEIAVETPAAGNTFNIASGTIDWVTQGEDHDGGLMISHSMVQQTET